MKFSDFKKDEQDALSNYGMIKAQERRAYVDLYRFLESRGYDWGKIRPAIAAAVRKANEQVGL